MSENASEITDYSKEVEDLFINFMISKPDLFVRCKGIIKSDYFDNVQNKETIAFIESYSADFSSIPSLPQIKALTGKEIDLVPDEATMHEDWFLREFPKFCRHKGLRAAILDSPKLLESGRYGEVETSIKNAVQIALVKDLGTDYYANPKERLEAIRANKGQLSTGWKTMDEKLHGGVNRGEIMIFAGQCVTADTKVTAYNLSDTVPKEYYVLDLNDRKKFWFVNSPDGFVPVERLISKGTYDIYCVKFTDGGFVTASPMHMFENTFGGWVSIINLKPGVKLISENGTKTIENIYDTGEQDLVFDLVVNSNNHRYYTNGISSHNSGAGKSLFLQNFAVNWAHAGLNVVYLSLELSENLCSMRIDAMHTGYETRDVMRNIEDVHMRVVASQRKSKGALRVKQLPNGCNANDIRAYIKEYEIHCKRKVDALLVDYLDLMMPMSKKISAENLFVKDKYITEELRNLAVELNVIVVTASQLNRCLAPDTIVTVKDKGYTPISDLLVGNEILSYDGYNTVLEVVECRQEAFLIKLANGLEIACSKGHVFPTTTGLESLNDSLGVGSLLFVDNEIICREIISVKPIGEINTIDITISGNHLFYANDILTHNSSYEDIEYDASMISGGISKINTADNVIGIFTSAAMKEAGRYQIQFMKTRSSSGVGSKIDLAFDNKSLRITDLDEADESAIASTTKTIYDQIKNKSLVKSPDMPQPVVKVDPVEGALALRQFIKRNK